MYTNGVFRDKKTHARQVKYFSLLHAAVDCGYVVPRERESRGIRENRTYAHRALAVLIFLHAAVNAAK